MTYNLSMRTFLVSMLTAATLGLAGGTTPANAAASSSLPSVFCDFEEPFQWVVLSPEGVLVEDHDNGAIFNRYKPTSLRGSINSRLTVGLPASSGNSSIVLQRVDGELDSHVITFNDREGTCNRLPTGFLLRKIVGVSDDDELNIREAPNASAEIISSSSNGSLIWVKPTKAKWVQVAYVEQVGDEAPNEVFTGWANKAFITKTAPKIAHD
jgi:hypothetical protein